MCDRFGIANGTARVALSRMVDRGELANQDGIYSLAGLLLERQARQDASRTATRAAWDRSWQMAIVTATRRSSQERARMRNALAALGLGERREGVWMRPANLDPNRQPGSREALAGAVEWYTTRLAPDIDPCDLVSRLFDLESWAATAEALEGAMASAQSRLDQDTDAVVQGFMVASAALRHLTHDPQLPLALQPPGWHPERLRLSYRDFEADYQSHLKVFFRAHR